MRCSESRFSGSPTPGVSIIKVSKISNFPDNPEVIFVSHSGSGLSLKEFVPVNVLQSVLFPFPVSPITTIYIGFLLFFDIIRCMHIFSLI